MFYEVMKNIVNEIVKEVSGWNGVSSYPHRFGGTEFRFGKPELGHIHRNGLTDIPFPMKIRDELIKENIVHPHHILPETGWISFYVREDKDKETAIKLFRLSYLRYSIKRTENNSQLKDEIDQMNISEEIRSIYLNMFR